MVNGLAVLGWGVGGIEAEAAMLGQPISMLIPEVIGFRLSGMLAAGTTATDLVLTVTEMLRKKGVVGKFVEFFGPGLAHLSLEDRATIANMAPEYGATCGFFPTSAETLNYMRGTGRAPGLLSLVETYCRAQGLFWSPDAPEPTYTEVVALDLSGVEPSVAGPRRPQDRVALRAASTAFAKAMADDFRKDDTRRVAVDGANFDLGHGDVVIAAITSCTNTSNPSVMLGAALLARNAVAAGLQVKPWVKTSLAPGSQVVTEYLKASGLQKHLDKLGFDLVGYGCTTCIGNSGPLPEPIAKAIRDNDLVAAAVLSGNRNFEGRINPEVRANYLASPPLVVAYALAGSLRADLTADPLGTGKNGKPVYLRDIWPGPEEIASFVRKYVTRASFRSRYRDVFKGDAAWAAIRVAGGLTFDWNGASTYVQNPPYFTGMTMTAMPLRDVEQARILGLFLDSITTDHISPAGAIKLTSPAGKYLVERQVAPADFNSYGARRGNHEVMMRGTFANIRIKNQMVPGIEGGVTRVYPGGQEMPIYDAAMLYRAEATPLVVFAGKEYGTGSSRDWAAKGTSLLGIRAVIAQSFERIHRSNLIGMGVLPLQFQEGESWQTFALRGDEVVSISGISVGLKPRAALKVEVAAADGSRQTIHVRCRIDTVDELDYFKAGGILPFVLRNLANAA